MILAGSGLSGTPVTGMPAAHSTAGMRSESSPPHPVTATVSKAKAPSNVLRAFPTPTTCRMLARALDHWFDSDRRKSPKVVSATITASIQYCDLAAAFALGKITSARS